MKVSFSNKSVNNKLKIFLYFQKSSVCKNNLCVFILYFKLVWDAFVTEKQLYKPIQIGSVKKSP